MVVFSYENIKASLLAGGSFLNFLFQPQGDDTFDVSTPMLEQSATDMRITTPVLEAEENHFYCKYPLTRDHRGEHTVLQLRKPEIKCDRDHVSYQQSSPVMHSSKKDTFSHGVPAAVKSPRESKFSWLLPVMSKQRGDQLQQSEPEMSTKKEASLEQNPPRMQAVKRITYEQTEPRLSEDKPDEFELTPPDEYVLRGQGDDATTLEKREPELALVPESLEKSQPLIDLRTAVLDSSSPYLHLVISEFLQTQPRLVDVPCSLEHAKILELSRNFELKHPVPNRFEKEVLYLKTEPELVIMPSEFLITTPVLLDD